VLHLGASRECCLTIEVESNESLRQAPESLFGSGAFVYMKAVTAFGATDRGLRPQGRMRMSVK
jgi:hypothetical protein